jgi:cytoskeletal protein RodZ
MAIGKKLEDARNRKGISIREASESTKIRGDFLTSFEAGKFEINLPEVYLRGFIRVYARFLGIDPESAVADLNLEIGSGKSKNAKKTIGKIGGSESAENMKEISSVEAPRNNPSQLSVPKRLGPKFLLLGILASTIAGFAILLIVIFSSDDENGKKIADTSGDSVNQSIRETKSKEIETSKSPIDNKSSESMLNLAAIGAIERLIISDEGKTPKVFHEFKNIQSGWEKAIPFTNSFRCYSSSLQNIRFAVDDGMEKQVNGEGAGNFSWSIK